MTPVSEKGSHAIVVGAGLGGLAAAVRLSGRGYSVTVVDRLDGPGGRAKPVHQDGFTFDAGPTIITAPQLLRDLWGCVGADFDADVELRALDPFYSVTFPDGRSFDYSGDQAAMEAEIAKFNPSDIAGYRKFISASRDIYDIGFEGLADAPFSRFSDMLRVLPDLVRLRADRSVHRMVARLIKDPQLRQVFSFHPLLVGGNPFDTTSVYSLIAHLERSFGVHYAMGGTASIVDALYRLLQKQGVQFYFGRTVREISVVSGRASGVVLEDGESLTADVVVSNADSAWTLRNLVPAEHRKRWTDQRIERSKYSMSLFVWYFGTERQYPEVPHHTIILGPRYQGLLKDIFDHRRLADDFSLYLHRPTATDQSIAPSGCDSFYVLSPVPHLDPDQGMNWEEHAESYRDAIATHLENTLLPGLRASMVTSHHVTPLHFRDNLLSYRGAAFGLRPTLTQSAWFRPHNADTELPGLFFVGAGTHPGAGVPGVLCSAAVLDKVVPRPQRPTQVQVQRVAEVTAPIATQDLGARLP